MRTAILQAFTQAASTVLAAEIGEPIALHRPRLQGGAYHRQDVTAMIRLHGDLDGAVCLSMEKAAAVKYASQVTGEEVTELNDLVQSGVAEMSNVIVGQASRLLEDQGCWVIVNPPSVVLGAGEHGIVHGVQRLVVPVTTPLGEIEVQLIMKAGQDSLSRLR